MTDPVAAQYRDMAYASHEVWVIQMWDAMNNQIYRKSQEIEQLRAELDAIKRTREQERDYADVCYENERLRDFLLSFQELLGLDPENHPGTDLGRLMLEVTEHLRHPPQPGNQT